MSLTVRNRAGDVLVPSIPSILGRLFQIAFLTTPKIAPHSTIPTTNYIAGMTHVHLAVTLAVILFNPSI
ncbi:hypothetical protein DFR44_10649 [Hydromonas duriensis]|uniref:Uncharacterized protein n=1 Tax=Hydromonas duriensis TaxID=1527608 RepID=A0A4R6Y990_9BURK|nr:hypothetical protein DFR44_10649 [Hydromonas duriensis]